MNEIEKVKQDHPPSYQGIIRTYNLKEISQSWPFWVSIGSSILVSVGISLSKKTSYDVLMFWVDQVMSVFPNLLGFNLGGYALIVGFGNSELIQSMTKQLSGKKVSIFQKLSGIFAFAILIQLAAFVTAFVIKSFDQFHFDTINQALARIVNIGLASLLSFLGFWGLLILPNLVSNVFTFGQMHHSYLTLKRLKSEQSKQKTQQ